MWKRSDTVSYSFNNRQVHSFSGCRLFRQMQSVRDLTLCSIPSITGKYTALLAVLIVGSFVIPMVRLLLVFGCEFFTRQPPLTRKSLYNFQRVNISGTSRTMTVPKSSLASRVPRNPRSRPKRRDGFKNVARTA